MSEERNREIIELLTKKNVLMQELAEMMLFELCEFCAEASDGNAHRCPRYIPSTDGRKRCNGAKYSTCATHAVICKAREWKIGTKLEGVNG